MPPELFGGYIHIYDEFCGGGGLVFRGWGVGNTSHLGCTNILIWVTNPNPIHIRFLGYGSDLRSIHHVI